MDTQQMTDKARIKIARVALKRAYKQYWGNPASTFDANRELELALVMLRNMAYKWGAKFPEPLTSNTSTAK